ncbi:phage head-tail connector protein [Streptococcus pseudopneumoniae]|uniref:phage head-tail connector protein n=1 Tax=Streptococcus pseudopneumoniae TaxID=257758 RepID=UPI00066C31A2|nr:phage head-tail connector protein [Streptococcus pseudopneumoniae]
MADISQVKTLLGIDDNLQDTLLHTISTLTTSHFLAYAGVDDVPQGLDYIITEVMIKRFNRIGAEGLTRHDIEGASMSFSSDDFKEYDSIIKRVCAKTFNAGFKML